MAFSDKSLQVLLCLGKTGAEAMEVMEMFAKEFPGHSVVLVNASEPVNKTMLHLDDPINHLGAPVEITWCVHAGWGDAANPDVADWVMRNWKPHLYIPTEQDVDESEELADLDEFDRRLGILQVDTPLK